MPLTRYRIKDEYGLADPEVYRSADKDDPEALLEGVAMAGLVGLLRQLGDLAEFAAEIFHDLHEEVMATAARGHGLTVRIQQLEAEFPPIEKALLLQTNHSLYYSNAGTDWHPNLQSRQNLITRGDLPRFVMDSYEESRGPPRLFLLDKFDVGGAGACLKRYTDPSFLKMGTASSGLSTTEVQREKKTRKGKKKGSRWKNGETPECVPSHGKLHQLLMEERIENAYNDPTRRVKLKRRQLNRSPFESKSERSLMEKFVGTPSPKSKTIREVPLSLPSLEWRSDDTHGQGLGEVEISIYSPGKISPQENGSPALSLYKQGFESKRFLDCDENHESIEDGEEEETASAVVVEKVMRTSGADSKSGRADGYNSEERTSEVDSYVDALATMESDVETDSNWRPKQDMHLQNVAKGGTDSEANEEELELQTEFSASQSLGNSGSEDEGSSYGRSSSSFSNQYGGDRFSNVSLPTKRTATESVTSSDNQLVYNKEVQDRESEELRVSNCTGTEDKGLPNFVEASCISCPTESNMAAPLEAEPVLLDGSEHEEVKHSLGIPYSQTGANDVDSAATKEEDDSVSTNSVECLTMNVGAKEEVCSKEVEHPVDLELPSKMESNGFPVYETLNMETVPEETGENLSTVSSESHSSTIEKDHFSQIATDVERVSIAGSEVSDTAVRLEIPTLQANEPQLDKSGTERNISNVDVECYEGNTEESSRKLDDENIDSLNLNVDVEGVASISGSDDHANASDFVVAGDNFDDSVASGHEQFLDKSENATLRESLSDVDVYNDEGNCVETVLEGERIGSSTCDVELGGGERTLAFPSEVSVSENLIISDNSVSDEVYGGGVANAGAAPSTEDDKVNYLDRDDADCGDSSSVDLEYSDSDIRVPSEERLNMKEQGVIGEEDELQVAPPCSDPKYSDSLCAEDVSMLLDHADTAEDNSESSLAEGTLSRDFYENDGDDVLTPPVNSALASGSKNLLGELETEAAEDRETNEAVGSENLSEMEDGEFQDELSEANEATKLLGHQFEESELPISSNQDNFEDSAAPANTDDPAFGLISEEAGIDVEDTPPLPPQPPMQWIGKPQNASASSETDLPGFSFGLLPPLQPFEADEKPSYNGLQTSEEKALPSGDQHPSPFGHEHDQMQHDSYQTGPNPFSLPMPFMNRDIQFKDHVIEEKNSTSSSLLHNTEVTKRVELPSPALSEEVSQSDLSASIVDLMVEDGISELSPEPSSSVQPAAQILAQKLSEVEDLQDIAENPEEDKSTESSLPSDQIHQPTVSGVKDHLRHTPEIAEEGNCSDSCTATSSGQGEQQPQYNLPDSDGHFTTEKALQENSESGKPNGTLTSNIPRPPKPLIDAVAAHDRSKLRKVAERVRPNLAPKLEERDSMLEQIRAKSFNLKPAVLTRPSIPQGPRTNLRVAAILEKANAIRQAMGGSDDDDDDGDSWSDSD